MPTGLDDLWRPQDARAFDALGQLSRLLVTTRDADLLIPIGASEFSIGVPDEESALELLASFSGQDRDTLPAAARQVVESCGHLPLALAVAGAQIRGGAAWEDALSALERGRLEFPGYGSIFNALQVSTEALATSDRDRYLELAVFPEDADVPVETICTLWHHTGGMEAPDARELLRRLHRRALLIRSNDGRRISFHDLQHDFLRLNIPSLVKGHAALVDAYRAVLPLGWASGPDDAYFFQHLLQHLIGVDRLDEVKALLCDYDWLTAKLGATNVTAVLADYDLISNDADLTLVQQALRLSIPALLRDRSHLSGLLLGRLRGADRPAVRNLVVGAEKGPGRAWLRPRFASLTPPGGPLRQILVGHRAGVTAVTLAPDGSRALSGSWDTTLRLWDLATGETLRTLKGHTSAVFAVALLADGSRALSGSDDNTLRLWNLANGDCLAQYAADAAITCVAFARDDLIVAGSADGKIHILEIREH
jgi:WD40 repeat protein